MITKQMSCSKTQKPSPIAQEYYGGVIPAKGTVADEHRSCLITAGWPTGFPCFFDYAHRKYALIAAQTSYFTSIVVVQWADIIICKTRTLSVVEQKMNNRMLN